MKKNKNTNTTYEVVRKMRGDWGNVNPVTKIIPNKKKDYFPSYDYYEEDDYIYADVDFEPGRYYWDEMEANP